MTLLKITPEEYYAAISKVLTEALKHDGSDRCRVLNGLLANTWDSSITFNAMAELSMLDLLWREVALQVFVGRLLYGRPLHHPRYEEIIENALLLFKRTDTFSKDYPMTSSAAPAPEGWIVFS